MVRSTKGGRLERFLRFLSLTGPTGPKGVDCPAGNTYKCRLPAAKPSKPGFARWKCTPIPTSRYFPRRGKFALRLPNKSCSTLLSLHSPPRLRRERWCRRHQREEGFRRFLRLTGIKTGGFSGLTGPAGPKVVDCSAGNKYICRQRRRYRNPQAVHILQRMCKSVEVGP